MKKRIFYSWQSDLPAEITRGLILQSLQNAGAHLAGDASIGVDPVVDRDTDGIAGSPEIAGTILTKISASDAFVADVSLISPPDARRRCPNPNVLLELGFAISALGWHRIVMVMNTTWGDVSNLPFDLRGRRVLTYAIKAASLEHTGLAREAFEVELVASLKGIFEHQAAQTAVVGAVSPSIEELAVRALESAASDRAVKVRRFINELDHRLIADAPDLSGSSQVFESLKTTLDAVVPAVTAYGRVATLAAETNHLPSLLELYRGLERIAERYDPQAFESSSSWQGDFWRFLGHELVVMLVATMIREDLWESLALVLGRTLVLEGEGSSRRDIAVSDLYREVVLCTLEGQLRGRSSHRAVVLRERHSEGPLVTVVDFKAFMDADYFMFLRTELPPTEPNSSVQWIPESAIFLHQPPRYLLEARHAQMADRLALAIGVDGKRLLRERLLQRHARLADCFPGAVWPPDPFEDHMEVIRQLGV